MKLPKDTRAAIYGAGGKPVEIEIPKGEQCRKWQTYVIEGNRRRRPRAHLDADRLFARPMIFVESIERRSGTLFATVRMVDPSAYLARQQGRAHPRQYTESIQDSIDDAERVGPEYQEGLSRSADHVRVKTIGERRAERDLADAKADLEQAKASGEPTALAEGRVGRAKRRLEDIHAPVARRETPKRPPASSAQEPEPPPVSTETVLRALRDDDAASDIAIRLGRPPTKLRSIVSALQELRERELVFYYVDADDEGEQPVGRWRHVRNARLGEAA